MPARSTGALQDWTTSRPLAALASPSPTSFNPQPQFGTLSSMAAAPPAGAGASMGGGNPTGVLDWTTGRSSPVYESFHITLAENVLINAPADAARLNELMRSYTPPQPVYTQPWSTTLPVSSPFSGATPAGVPAAVVGGTASGTGRSQLALQSLHSPLAQTVAPSASLGYRTPLNEPVRTVSESQSLPGPPPSTNRLPGSNSTTPVQDWTTTGLRRSSPAYESSLVTLVKDVPINTPADADRLNELMRSATPAPLPAAATTSSTSPFPSQPPQTTTYAPIVTTSKPGNAGGLGAVEDWTASGAAAKLSGWETLTVLVPPPGQTTAATSATTVRPSVPSASFVFSEAAAVPRHPQSTSFKEPLVPSPPLPLGVSSPSRSFSGPFLHHSGSGLSPNPTAATPSSNTLQHLPSYLTLPYQQHRPVAAGSFRLSAGTLPFSPNTRPTTNDFAVLPQPSFLSLPQH
eukprot:GGOE01029089.1.p1 GENE.GGOE01029089.1~~GGOE01029089.1.p1  ORF type:complete len:479 (-),score=85.49 GGOE01029089.1:583-1965(-)